ncbi:hypothetical protein MRX96_014624 [Rhipicephalus microplus]
MLRTQDERRRDCAERTFSVLSFTADVSSSGWKCTRDRRDMLLRTQNVVVTRAREWPVGDRHTPPESLMDPVQTSLPTTEDEEARRQLFAKRDAKGTKRTRAKRTSGEKLRKLCLSPSALRTAQAASRRRRTEVEKGGIEGC